MNNSIDFQINIGENATISPCIKKRFDTDDQCMVQFFRRNKKNWKKKFGSYSIYINFV